MPKDFVQRIAASSLVKTPWKNGTGSTAQIAIHPANSSLEKNDYSWRLSTAEVSQSGAFSVFPDFERLLTIVRGEELILEFSDLRKSLKPGTVVTFHGEEQIECFIPQGPITDLGLIYDPDQVVAKMSVVELNGRPRSFALSAPTVFFFCASGEIACSVYPGEFEYGLGAGDSLRVNHCPQERVVLLDPGLGKALLVAVEVADVEVRSN